MNKQFKVGDYVTRISHSQDLIFRISNIITTSNPPYCILKGIELRLTADAPLSDLVKVTSAEISRYRQHYLKRSTDLMGGIRKRRHQTMDHFLSRLKISYQKKQDPSELEIFELPGTVLHLDGDKEYLDLCMATYKQLNIRACGYHIAEAEQANAIKNLLIEHMPDIVIATGHDGLIKGKKNFSNLDSYRNSRHFVNTVRKCREYEPSRDELVVFAGACQSHYESLIHAGANFASSPRRVLIHAYDPVFIAEKVAFTPFYQMVPIKETINETITGTDGVGGIETKGRLRLGFPKSPY